MRWRKRIEARLDALEARDDRATTTWTDMPSAPIIYITPTEMQLAFSGFEGYVDDETEEWNPGVYL